MKIIKLQFSPTFLFLTIILFSASCAKSDKNPESNQTAKNERADVSRSDIFTQEDFSEVNLENIKNTNINPPSDGVRVVIHDYKGDYQDDARRNFASETAALLERVINSVKFKELVLKEDFLETNGLTSEQIYELIRKAHEPQGLPGTDGVLDLRVNTVKWDACYACRRPGDWCTVGADGGSSGVFNTCTKFIDDRIKDGEYSELAGHYMHEYLHLLKFSHAKYTKDEPERKRTVPYKIGSFVKALVTNYGEPLKGVVKNDQRFETVINGDTRLLKIYKSSMHVPGMEPLDLSKYINKNVKLKVEVFTDSEAYGAVIIR